MTYIIIVEIVVGLFVFAILPIEIIRMKNKFNWRRK